MKSAKRTLISLIIACVTAVVTILMVGAISGYYYVNESPLYKIIGSGTLTSVSTSSCYGGDCRYMYQDTVDPAVYRWGYSRANIYQWWVYRPYTGEAAAKYAWFTYYNGVKDNWVVTVDQSANHGTWAYLGYSDYVPNSYGELRLGNQCVSGYWCGGLKVYWDEWRYNTNP